ncbi:MAG TPA: MarR family transcriptional regulator, partial [Nitrososphaeraceae archaeon]
KLTKAEVETILKELESQRLVIKFEKKIFFLGKRMQYKLTDTGLKVLTSKQQELENKLRQVQQWYSQGDKAQLQTFMGNNRSWMPFLIFSGIMDMVFFMSLMSFMGMTLNPMESSMAGDTGDTGGTGSESDSGAGTETGATENVDMQGGDIGGGGFDFDGGGFDSF